MKNLIAIAVMAISSLAAWATTYTGQLTVTINNDAVQQSTSINIDAGEQSGTYTLSLNNFVLEAGGQQMGVGNIVLPNVPGTTVAGVTTINFNDSITIQPGDKAGIDPWIGPMLPPVPIKMTARFNATTLYSTIDIDMQETIRQTIQVEFTSQNCTVMNSGFENWHKAGEQDEPNTWHSFGSATGDLAALAGAHVAKSALVRPGSNGKASAALYSSNIVGIIANGTMTTGRLNAAAVQAENVDNHAYVDLSKTDVDGNGDPFYSEITTTPDSIALWVRFKQEKPNADYPYATVSAALVASGSYYQDPEDKAYGSDVVVAKAKNATIESNGAAWQRIAVPFNYAAGAARPKALLATISTNATPGKGGGVDSLYVDDLELVYNATIDSARIGGTLVKFDASGTATATVDAKSLDDEDVVVYAGGKGTITGYTIQPAAAAPARGKALGAGNYTIAFTAYSQDLKRVNTYNVNVGVTAVSSIEADANRTVQGIYDLQGRRVSNDAALQGIYIVRYTDGTAAKVIKR